MTDKFEEWLEEKTATAERHKAREAIFFREVLDKYREFLKERTVNLDKLTQDELHQLIFDLIQKEQKAYPDTAWRLQTK